MHLGARCRRLVGRALWLRGRFGLAVFLLRFAFPAFRLGAVTGIWRFVLILTIVFDGHFQQVGAFRKLVAFLYQDLANLAGIRGRDFHGGLVGFHRDQRVFLTNRVAFSHVDFDHRHVVEAIQRRHLHHFGAGAAGLFLLRCRLAVFRFGLGFLLSLIFRLVLFGIVRATSVSAGRQHADNVAFLHLVTHLHGDFGDLASRRGRQFYRGFVGFHGQNRIFFLYRVPFTDDDFDDLDFICTAEIGNLDFLFTHGGLLSSAPGSVCCDRFRTCA